MSGSGEFDIIARHFAPLAKRAPGAFGLLDDAALVNGLIVTADAIVAGVHFLPDDPPDTVARKLLRVNLSDIAAKGGRPLGYLLTAAFPRDAGSKWIAGFAKGLRQDQRQFDVSLYGGDTVATPGPATFSVTMFGRPNRRMVRRNGARVGDLVCVTGTIGDGGLGLQELRSPHRGLTAPQRRFLADRYRLPQPRVRFGQMLSRFASAALDVSDGLVQDLGHLAKASGVRIALEAPSVPLSPAAVRLERADPGVRGRAMAAGDDYEIAFTVPRRRLEACRTAAAETRTRVTVIGRVDAGSGVIVLDSNGNPVDTGRGFDHFAGR